MWTQISGRMPASSQASRALSTASLTVVKQGLPGVVETQQVAVLGKELADGDVALAGGHRLGGGPAARPRGRGAVAAGRAAVGAGRGGGFHFRGRD